MIKKLNLLILVIFTVALNNICYAQTAAVTQQTQKTQQTQAPIKAKEEGFTITPANPNTTSPRKFLFEIKPGDTATDYAYIQNLADEKATFLLYGSDSTLSKQGSLAYKTRADNGAGAGKWIVFDQPKIELGPQEAKIVKFTVNIPKDTKLDNYKAGITMEKTKQDINNPNITIATRVIIHGEIKVTNEPKVISKEKPVNFFSKPAWQNWYFWISLTLFIISLTLLIWTTINEHAKKKSKHSSKHKS